MSDPEEQRGTDRSAAPIRRPERCRRRRFIVPGTYEELEALVERWMAGCVQSRTIVSDRGTSRPARRERELVRNNQSLRAAWARLRHIRGRRSGLDAEYVSRDGVHVEAVIFSMIPMRAVIGEGDVEATEIRPGPPLPPVGDEPPDTRPPGGGPPEPDIPEPPPEEFIIPSGDLIDDMKKVAEILLKGYRHAIETQRQLPYYNGAADGYCDTIARAAVDERLRQAMVVPGFRASSLVDTRGPIPDAALVRGSAGNVRGFQRGYRDGRRLAYQWLRSHEREARSDLPTYDSAKMLASVRHHYGPLYASDIRRALLRLHFPGHPGASQP